MELDFVLEDENNIEFELDETENEDFELDNVVIKTGGGTVRQVYRGPDMPTDDEILIWIDTYTEPVIRTAMLTADGEYFVTSDGLDFVVREPSEATKLITSDGEFFYTSDGQEFVVNDQDLGMPLYTRDNKEFYEANNKKFITKGEL